MLRRKHRNAEENFDEAIRNAKYACVLQALKDILRVEVKGTDEDGNGAVDPAATVSAMKSRARIALDFVEVLGANKEE